MTIVVALLTGAVAGAGCAGGVASDGGRATLISVAASGRVSVTPDTALIQVGAEVRAPNLADATGDVAQRMSAVLARVKSLGVEAKDIRTVTYSIDPLTAQRRLGDPPDITGYRVANVVQIKIRNLDEVGRIVDAAVKAGANTMHRPRFTLDDPAKPEAEARALAVRNAAAKARQLAEVSGVRLGELVSLSEKVVYPHWMTESFSSRAGVAPGPVEIGQIEISVNVDAQYRIAQP
jgi:uncharacterized protein YggE